MKNQMSAEAAITLYNLLNVNGIKAWVDGGWAVDALLGKQTRDHEDLDVVIQSKDIPKARQILTPHGYQDIPRDDTSSWNFALGDHEGHLVDVHTIIFDDQGNGLYGPKEKGVMYPAASLTGHGVINGFIVNCISAQDLVNFHSGYDLTDKDRHDVLALCHKFNLSIPTDYH